MDDRQEAIYSVYTGILPVVDALQLHAGLTGNAELAKYALTAEGLAALATKVQTYRGMLGATRASISERTVATAEILALMEWITKHLDTKLDKAAGTYFRAANPQFHAGYEAARTIVD